MIARPTWASRRREGALRDLEDELPVVLAGLEARERRLRLASGRTESRTGFHDAPSSVRSNCSKSRGLPSCVP